MSKLSENLKKIRKDHNLSQEDLAEKLGVSRQAISKWESGQAYPEMEKMIQLTNMFNLNLDDLINNDVRESKNEREKKNNINKCINDFLNFMTDSTNMFSKMTFKSKRKCIAEQIVIIGFLIILSVIIGAILGGLFRNVFYYFMAEEVYNGLFAILKTLYVIASIILIIVIFVHIFKTRYLDYYFGNETNFIENNSDIEIDENKEKKTTTQNSKEETIVIRDPKHSEYKFINVLIKYIVFLLKVFVLGIGMLICIPIIFSIIMGVISFVIVKTGLLFVGILISIISCTTFFIIVLLSLLNFVLNRKNNKKVMIYTLLISIISFGIGCGLAIISLINFNYIDTKNSSLYENSEIIVSMDNEMFFNNYYGEKINYIEESRDDIRLEFYKNKYCDVNLHKYSGGEYSLFDSCSTEFKMLSDYVKDINNKNIYPLSTIIYEVTIYASKENIEILKNNLNKYYDKNNQISNYQHRIYELEANIDEYIYKINELEEIIKNYEEMKDNDNLNEQ